MPHIRTRITAELESGTLLFDKVTTTAHNTVSMKSEIESEVDEEGDDNSSLIYILLEHSSILYCVMGKFTQPIAACSS